MGTATRMRKLADHSRYAILVILSVLVIFLSIYCLLNGLTEVFPLLFYPPIILSALWFLKKGVIYAGLMGLVYLTLVIYFTSGNPLDVISAVARLFIFVIFAIVVMVFSMKINEQQDSIGHAETKFQTIWENIHTGIILVDADTHLVLAVNPEAERLTGYREQEMIGRCCHQFICPAEKGKCPVSNLNQIVDHSERILLTRNGTPMLVLKTVTQAIIEGRNVFIESFVPAIPRKITHNTPE
jgi:PAS domain S-box-containing protein